MKIFKTAIIAFSVMWLSGCGGVKTQPTPPAPPSSVKSPSQTSGAQKPVPENSNTIKKGGGYYLDDGPDDNPPSEINSIPNAIPKNEPYLTRSNKPYVALGQQYVPMTSFKPYKKQGVATWYGKRYHGRKTSSGEVYDMHGMTAAHPILPIPSYVKVTNVNSGAFVVVRVNDRGPFKHDRLIDLSYVAAHKLGIVANGSGKVEVELIDTRNLTGMTKNVSPVSATSSAVSSPTNATKTDGALQFFVQVGAFKSELNANQLKQKIETQNATQIGLSQNVLIASVYNNGFYKVRLGPYTSTSAADLSASEIRKTYDISAIVLKE